MPDRYYSSRPITESVATLEGTEAHHLLHVMRAKPGLELIIFDGQGGEFAAQITSCQRSTVEVTVGSRQPIERELPFPLTLATALPKGDRSRWLIEKCVELGVTQLIPLQTTRSINKTSGKAEGGATKLTRYTIEASKQCGRNRLMEITAPVSWSTFLDEATAGQRLIAHPGGQKLNEVHRQTSDRRQVVIAIGPEGGFTNEEVVQADEAGWHRVGLGERILRIETAALALVSSFSL